MSESTNVPLMMDDACQRSRRTGVGLPTFRVEFSNPHHMRDARAFVKSTGQEDELMSNLARIWSLFLVDSMTHDVRVVISPDSPRRPSFAFTAWSKRPDQDWKQEKLILAGGLIYRDDQGWSIHT